MVLPTFKPSSVSVCLCNECGNTISRNTLSIPMDAIRSYILPTASQAQDIQRESDADLASISAFAEAISRTQGVLEDLRAKQDALVESLARKRALLSPIRRLPLELLSTIISLVVTRAFRHKRDSSLTLRHPVLRVCQRWRALARATPQLWADIVLFPLYDHSWSYTLRECLQLSDPLPVDVRINEHCALWHGSDFSFAPFLNYDKSEWQHAADAMLRAASRWRSLALDEFELPNEQSSSPLPLSEIGEVDLTPVLASNPRVLLGQCLGLSRLYLANVDPAALPLNWAQLREISLWMVARCSSGDLTTCIDTLRLCPNLQVLAITARGYRYQHREEARLCLANLRVLELRYQASWLLDRVIVPELQELRLADPFGNLDRSMLHFAANNKEAAANLRSLCFMDREIGEVDWAQLFAKYPSISQLGIASISWDGWNNGGFRTLAQALVDKPGLLPQLTRLRLWFGPDMHSACVGALALLVDHRGVRQPEAEDATRIVEIEAHEACLDFHSRRGDPFRHSGIGIYKGGTVKLLQHPHEEADKFLMDLARNRIDSADWTLYYEDEDVAN